MAIEFIYFDLGNVVLNFSHRRAAEQMAAVAGVEPEVMWQLVFAGDLERRCETGELDGPALYEILCEKLGKRPDFRQLEEAGSAIFEINAPILPVLANLRSAGYRLGILSNTSASHWNYISNGRYAIIPDLFDPRVLSYEVGCMKPDPEIYRIAAEKVHLPPEKVFFIDDREENVAGARRAGLDAVRYTGPLDLVNQLRRRGARFNY